MPSRRGTHEQDGHNSSTVFCSVLLLQSAQSDKTKLIKNMAPYFEQLSDTQSINAQYRLLNMIQPFINKIPK